MKNNFLKSFMVMLGGISISPSTNQIHNLSLKDNRFKQIKPLMKKPRKTRISQKQGNKVVRVRG